MSDQQKKIRILLVDDEEDFRTSARDALQRRGLEVDTAADGVEALKALEGRSYDAVLLDVKMPGIDGAEVARIIRRDQPELPIVILTGHGSIPQAFEATKSGIYDYLPKPCNMDQLALKLKDAVLDHPVEETERQYQDLTAVQGTASILLVDDEEELLTSLKPVLERRKLVVTTACNGREALDVLGRVSVDVVLLDVKMPGLDGLDVLSQIKNLKPDVEVVLLTGHPNIDTAMQGIKRGAFEYLVKPPDIDELVKVLRKAYLFRQTKLEEQQEEKIQEILKKRPE
ncbi:response regulator [bacterium]|nr:response regulator [bacterium]MBU1651936.1 response regulator [bacterium]